MDRVSFASSRFEWELRNPDVHDKLDFFDRMGYGLGLGIRAVVRSFRKPKETSEDLLEGSNQPKADIHDGQWSDSPHSNIFVEGVIYLPLIVAGCGWAWREGYYFGVFIGFGVLVSSLVVLGWSSYLQRKYVVEHPSWTKVDLNPMEATGFWIGSLVYDTGMPIVERIRNRNNPDGGLAS